MFALDWCFCGPADRCAYACPGPAAGDSGVRADAARPDAGHAIGDKLSAGSHSNSIAYDSSEPFAVSR